VTDGDGGSINIGIQAGDASESVEYGFGAEHAVRDATAARTLHRGARAGSPCA